MQPFKTTEVQEAKLPSAGIFDFHFPIKHAERTVEPANMLES